MSVNLLPSSSTTHSARSSRLPPPADTVVTVPPWARDEPPSPDDAQSVHESENRLSVLRPSAAASHASVGHYSHLGAPSPWWAFTLPRNRDSLAPPQPSQTDTSKQRGVHLSFRNRSMSWLHPNHLRRHAAEGVQVRTENDHSHDWNIHLNVPEPEPPFTLSHNRTPGWDTPWTPKPPVANTKELGNYFDNVDPQGPDVGKWSQRGKRLRVYILSHHHVPLIFRLINIALTSAALALAVRTRSMEERHGVKGAVGSSATIVIIFAPLTLVHVVIAIYLEYFGRPLGLWRTSRKLAHTLFEVLFICAWSAALSLCFDNFFTSLVPCAAWSRTSWYNSLARPSIPQLEALDKSSSSAICDSQLALIYLVGIGLVMYCVNLVISLFRIFEKMKYHPPPPNFR